jgi:hypothetical protein
MKCILVKQNREYSHNLQGTSFPKEHGKRIAPSMHQRRKKHGAALHKRASHGPLRPRGASVFSFIRS